MYHEDYIIHINAKRTAPWGMWGSMSPLHGKKTSANLRAMWRADLLELIHNWWPSMVTASKPGRYMALRCIE
eukprot:300706-Amphidinium_carterae.1